MEYYDYCKILYISLGDPPWSTAPPEAPKAQAPMSRQPHPQRYPVGFL